MTLNAAGDLERFAWKDSATAFCDDGPCEFIVRGQSSGATGTKARAHTRETGHPTVVIRRHITKYRCPEASAETEADHAPSVSAGQTRSVRGVA